MLIAPGIEPEGTSRKKCYNKSPAQCYKTKREDILSF
ncbi:hypothetical protein MPC4_50063 [Methylocella tundrae]|uniref:Uncharacterized protein n=1 Tax=Methylocella tundrae TaxID=227605 RepID=A0A8B6MB42_METTU|nr:hypothetical protein MPC4_50063 [Methylocella tundrae]